MREAYQAQLDGLADQLADMSVRVGLAMDRATRALLNRDLALAEQVISEDAEIDELRTSIEDRCIALLARFYERYADHAVSVARRVVFVVTGKMPGSLAG